MIAGGDANKGQGAVGHSSPSYNLEEFNSMEHFAIPAVR